jgi:hypothetical protein
MLPLLPLLCLAIRTTRRWPDMSFAIRTGRASMAGFIHRAGCDTAPIPATGRRMSAGDLAVVGLGSPA